MLSKYTSVQFIDRDYVQNPPQSLRVKYIIRVKIWVVHHIYTYFPLAYKSIDSLIAMRPQLSVSH